MVKRFVRILWCVLPAVCLFGCTVVLPAETGGVGLGSSSFFQNYTSECGDGVCKVKGSVRLHVTDAVVACFTAEEDVDINVQGSVRNTSGDVKLVYEAPDKSRTVIADGEDRKIDKTVAAVQGEGGIYFIGEGSCEFKLEITVGDGVVFGSGMDADSLEAVEELESPERLEKSADSEAASAGTDGTLEWTEDRETGEDLEGASDREAGDNLEGASDREADESLELPELADPGFPGVTDNWPESIVLEDRGMTASPLYVTFKTEKAMRVSVSCTTTGGDLHVKIVKGDAKKVCFDEKDPAGDYEVLLDEAGTYCLAVYARDHNGSIRIEPVEE